jgi:hypothetical protein
MKPIDHFAVRIEYRQHVVLVAPAVCLGQTHKIGKTQVMQINRAMERGGLVKLETCGPPCNDGAVMAEILAN